MALPVAKTIELLGVTLANLQDLYLNSSANSAFSLPSYSTPTSSSTESISSHTVVFAHSVTVSKISKRKWNLQNKQPPLSSAILNCKVIWHSQWGCKSRVSQHDARCELQSFGSCSVCVIQVVFLFYIQFVYIIYNGLEMYFVQFLCIILSELRALRNINLHVDVRVTSLSKMAAGIEECSDRTGMVGICRCVRQVFRQ
jgi:hypothetical protein